MEINIIYSLIIAATLQGFWLSFFILSSKKFSTKTSKFLGLLILAVTVTQLQYFLEGAGIISWQQFNVIYLPVEYLEAPFLYFFVLYYLYPDRTVRNIEKALFIPAGIFIVITLLYKSIAFSTNQKWEENSFLESLADLNDFYGDFINILLLLIVLSVSIYSIFKFQNQTKKYDRKTVFAELVWLKVLLIIILAALFIWFYYAVHYYIDQNASYLPVDIAVSIIIYLLGYIGIHKLNVLTERRNIRKQSYETNSYKIIDTTKNEHVVRIEQVVIQEKRFLDTNFSSETLAEELQLSKSHLSRIFNNDMEVSFTDYINNLRVEEAKTYLVNPEFSNYTLVAIGLEAGFNSKTTFNTAFKKLTGYTPSQFKKTHAN